MLPLCVANSSLHQDTKSNLSRKTEPLGTQCTVATRASGVITATRVLALPWHVQHTRHQFENLLIMSAAHVKVIVHFRFVGESRIVGYAQM